MAVEEHVEPVEGSAERLDELVGARLAGRFAYFFVVNEGDVLPDGTETESGLVIDEEGRVFAFWTGWNRKLDKFEFDTWEQVKTEPHWQDIAEYRRARHAVGLP